MKRYAKIAVKTLLALFFVGLFSMPFLMGDLKTPGNPLSHKKVTNFDNVVYETFELSETISPPTKDEVARGLMSNIPDFVKTPEGGTSWDVFGQTKQNEYNYKDSEGLEWSGVRPEFSEDLKKLDGKEILIQGYMFPLGQEEKQLLFLLGPFPVSCPYHYHVTPNLIIEVHAKTSITFNYDVVNIKGKLELVPKDDEYNVFYRLNDAELVK